MDTRRAEHELTAGTYYYENLAIGDFFTTGHIKITEALINGFADMMGDRFAVHMDDDFARELGFAGRIAHGLLGLCLIDGLKNQCPVQLQAVASLGWKDWSFLAPIYIDDTIAAAITVADMRLTTKGDRGIVELEFAVRNQKNIPVQKGRNILMMQCAPASEPGD